MRLWKLHPRFLDEQGLAGNWVEGLTARKKATEGFPKRYGKLLQLKPFRESANPVNAFDYYLHAIAEERHSRGRRADESYLNPHPFPPNMPVTREELEAEYAKLKVKVGERKHKDFNWREVDASTIEPNPAFVVVP